MNRHRIKYGNTIIKYSLKRRTRKTLQINVLPDLSVEAVAPDKIEIEKIRERLKKRAPWIIRQINYFSEFPPPVPPRKYESGETHRYLGRQYRLKIVDSSNEQVKLEGRYIKIYTVRKDDLNHKKNLLDKWYKRHAQIKFEKMSEDILSELRKYGIKKPVMTVRNMKKRWGSCIPDKSKIILNDILIKVPAYCIEYVICHELCHLKYRAHNKKYYDFLSAVMPDWMKRKHLLEHVEI